MSTTNSSFTKRDGVGDGDIAYIEVYLNTAHRTRGTTLSPIFELETGLDDILAVGVKSAELPWVPGGMVADTNKRYYIECDLLKRKRRTNHTSLGKRNILTEIQVPDTAGNDLRIDNKGSIYFHDLEMHSIFPNQNLTLHFNLLDELFQDVSAIAADWNITLALLIKHKELTRVYFREFY